MRAALIILALSGLGLAMAGPAVKNNQIDIKQQQLTKEQQQQYMTTTSTTGADYKQSQAVEILKQWCFASQMSHQELTASFKKLVQVVKASPEDQTTKTAVMSERICQSAKLTGHDINKSEVSATGNQVDAMAHELIKDVYMDALIACDTRDALKQLIEIIDSEQIDSVRAFYYMTRVAMTEKSQIKDENDVKQLAESFISQVGKSASNSNEAIERQKLFATTALLGKQLEQTASNQQLKDIAEKVAKTIVQRYVKTVSQSEVQQYLKQQQQQQQNKQVALKIAKRSAALKALANIPGWILHQIPEVESVLVELAQSRDEMVTVRQSAIECLEQNDQVIKTLKQITFDQEEPIEVRVAAYRALMTTPFAASQENKDMNKQQQIAQEIIADIMKFCQDERKQQQDQQLVLYIVSHLDNLRTSKQPELEAIKQVIVKDKQHFMQIQILCKKFKSLLQDIRKYSRNYKLEQEFNQLESGLILEGDLVYESEKQHELNVLPKLVRVNMSMPVMGETVNVIEITLRQDNMDEELFTALKMIQNTKFTGETMNKVVESFKQTAQMHANKKQSDNKKVEGDLTIKVDGQTILFVCLDDIVASSELIATGSKRYTRSVESLIETLLMQLKQQPINFNRGINFHINERLAKLLDIEANLIAGLRFESRASGNSASDFEVVGRFEPRFAFESIVGPAKMTSKKLLQRISTKSAIGFRYRFKLNELVDLQIDLPMQTMDLFTFETQLVEKSSVIPYSYTYLPESIYGQEDIYSPDEEYVNWRQHQVDYEQDIYASPIVGGVRKMKRSIFETKNTVGGTTTKALGKWMSKSFIGKRQLAIELDTPVEVARATGLRGKLRVIASPKDMTFLVQMVGQKYDAHMEGYRFQIQAQQQGKRSSEVQQYQLIVSTPGSRLDRTMEIRLVKQSSQQRTIVKSEIVSPIVSALAQWELVHDGRQFGAKLELASNSQSRYISSSSSSSHKQWRHVIEAGVQRGSQSQAGRIATTYKPYVNIDSTYMKRPVHMQGVVSYQQSPKSVISYEFKSPVSNDFIQGKIILDQRQSMNKRQYPNVSVRRSMQSPWEMLLRQDATLTGEFVFQVYEHFAKVHQMIDWSASKWEFVADATVNHKNLRKSTEQQLVAAIKINEDVQMWTAERRCPQQPAKQFRLTLQSVTKQPEQHQLLAEIRYNTDAVRRQLTAGTFEQVASYKHKVDYTVKSLKEATLAYAVELIASEYQLNEKLVGRTIYNIEKREKIVRSELSTGKQQAKFELDFISFEQHQINVFFQGQKIQHQTLVICDQRKYNLKSTTEFRQQLLAKIVVEMLKQTGDVQVLVDVPVMRTNVVADLKLVSGKQSSFALQSPRFSSKFEFAFDKLSNNKNRMLMPLRFRGDLKDMIAQEQYWMDGQWQSPKSFFRFDSPVYRSELEFEPRDWSAKMGVFARDQRNKQLDSSKLYTTDDSIIADYQPWTQLNQLNQLKQQDYKQLLKQLTSGSNKRWMVRSFLSSPVDELKKEARRALFEFADRRQAMKHSFEYQPEEERFLFDLERQPNTIHQEESVEPMHLVGDLTTDLFTTGASFKPSSVKLQSQWADLDMEAKPFDGQDCYAKLNVVSRQRRSAFKKHESEIRYDNKHGYKAWMKHLDSKDRRHLLEMEAAKKPEHWARIKVDSEKHGKGRYEHQWRHHSALNKRSVEDIVDEDIYRNFVDFEAELPESDKKWAQRMSLKWEEPREQRYSVRDYLKHLRGARLNSQLEKLGEQLYKIEADYKPEQWARLNMELPEEWQHQTKVELSPSYKLHSKHFQTRNKQPLYELLAQTKPVWGEHEDMVKSGNLLATLFKQPLKVDYSDKWGRLANFDYDVLSTGLKSVDGYRQKRASLLLSEPRSQFEHNFNLDFYPQATFGGKLDASRLFKRISNLENLNIKSQTKFGPIIVRSEADDKTFELVLKSPVFNGKLTGETGAKSWGQKQLIKLQVDNKEQSVKLAKIVRQLPIVNEVEFVQKLVRWVDQSRIEQQSELLVSFVDYIFKVKSATLVNKRPVVMVEGELNKSLNKFVAKIEGERVDGQLVIDLMSQSGQLVWSMDEKRTVYHETRFVRLSDNFYQVDSLTSYKQKPLVKVAAKISALIFEEPEHLLKKRGSFASKLHEQHMSTFEATLYQPTPIQVQGQFDCFTKEARVIFKDLISKKIQQTLLKFDDNNDTVIVDARLSSPMGQVYTSLAKINLPGVFRYGHCAYPSSRQSCASELIYQEPMSMKNYSAKYYPGEMLVVSTPAGRQVMNMAY